MLFEGQTGDLFSPAFLSHASCYATAPLSHVSVTIAQGGVERANEMVLEQLSRVGFEQAGELKSERREYRCTRAKYFIKRLVSACVYGCPRYVPRTGADKCRSRARASPAHRSLSAQRARFIGRHERAPVFESKTCAIETLCAMASDILGGSTRGTM